MVIHPKRIESEKGASDRPEAARGWRTFHGFLWPRRRFGYARRKRCKRATSGVASAVARISCIPICCLLSLPDTGPSAVDEADADRCGRHPAPVHLPFVHDPSGLAPHEIVLVIAVPIARADDRPRRPDDRRQIDLCDGRAV